MSREMKDSGIDWIGEIPRKWKVTKMLNFLRSPITDGPHETPTYVDRGVPFISVNSIDEYGNIDRNSANKISKEDAIEYNKKTQLSEGDILFTKSATIGKTAIVDKVNFMVWSPIAVLKPKEALDNRYLKYILDLRQFIQYVSNLGTKNTQINVGMRALEKAKIVIPPHSVQIQIANFLDEKTFEIDNIVEKTKQSIEELKSYKQSLITETVTKGLNLDVPMKESGVEWIGEIPTNWEINLIGSLYSQRNQKVSDREYEPLSVTKNGIVPQLETAAKSDNHNNRKLVKYNDFVINSRSDRKMSAGLSNYEGSVSVINTVLKSKYIHPEYSKYLLRNVSFAEEFYKWGTGIVDDLWSTRWDKMKNIPVPVPTRSEQVEIARYLNKRTKQIDNIIIKKQQMLKELESYKQSLVYEYVTGKKEVK